MYYDSDYDSPCQQREPSEITPSLNVVEIQLVPQNDEEPGVCWHGQVDIDSCYVSSKLPLSYIINAQEDLLAELECFRFQEAFTYNAKEWDLILSGSEKADHERLSASIYNGLPKRLRVKIWLYLAQVLEARYENLKKKVLYRSLVKQTCPDKHLVDKDIVRSFGNVAFFQNHEREKLRSLSRILYAYANYDPEVGYTQGLNFLGGMLLYLIQTEKEEIRKSENAKRDVVTHYEENIDMDSEEEAFWTLVYIMQEKKWRLMYLDNTPKLLELLEELEGEIKEKLPKVHEYLVETNCIAACFSQYFLTLFLFNTPKDFAKRILEVFLFGGKEALLHITVKLLVLTESDILEKNCMEELLPFLKTQLVPFALSKYQNQFMKFLADLPF